LTKSNISGVGFSLPVCELSHTSINFDEGANQNIVDKRYRVATAI